MKGETSPKFTVDQRKALADMLGPNSEARRRALAKYQESRESLGQPLIQTLAEEKGATALAEKKAELEKRKIESRREMEYLTLAIQEAHGKADEDLTSGIDECEQKIRGLGFDVDDDSGLFSLRWNTHDLRGVINERIIKEIGTESDIEQRFDHARAKVVSVETAEAAAEVVESLL